MLTVWSRDRLAQAADEGVATPDGRLPIQDVMDVVVSLTAAARGPQYRMFSDLTHIARRSRELGLTASTFKTMAYGVSDVLHAVSDLWDEDKHPRGRDGRFIEVGAKVATPNGLGQVVGFADGRVHYKLKSGVIEDSAYNEVESVEVKASLDASHTNSVLSRIQALRSQLPENLKEIGAVGSGDHAIYSPTVRDRQLDLDALRELRQALQGLESQVERGEKPDWAGVVDLMQNKHEDRDYDYKVNRSIGGGFHGWETLPDVIDVVDKAIVAQERNVQAWIEKVAQMADADPDDGGPSSKVVDQVHTLIDMGRAVDDLVRSIIESDPYAGSTDEQWWAARSRSESVSDQVQEIRNEVAAKIKVLLDFGRKHRLEFAREYAGVETEDGLVAASAVKREFYRRKVAEGYSIEAIEDDDLWQSSPEYARVFGKDRPNPDFPGMKTDPYALWVHRSMQKIINASNDRVTELTGKIPPVGEVLSQRKAATVEALRALGVRFGLPEGRDWPYYFTSGYKLDVSTLEDGQIVTYKDTVHKVYFVNGEPHLELIPGSRPWKIPTDSTEIKNAIPLDHPAGDIRYPAVRDALEEMPTAILEDVLPEGKYVLVKRKSRASRSADVLSMDQNTSASTVLHEEHHGWEWAKEWVGRTEWAMLAEANYEGVVGSRTTKPGGEHTVRKLSKITNLDYKADEVAMSDSLLEPYAGKVYTDTWSAVSAGRGGQLFELLTITAEQVLGTKAGLAYDMTPEQYEQQQKNRHWYLGLVVARALESQQ